MVVAGRFSPPTIPVIRIHRTFALPVSGQINFLHFPLLGSSYFIETLKGMHLDGLLFFISASAPFMQTGSPQPFLSFSFFLKKSGAHRAKKNIFSTRHLPSN